MVNNRGTEKVKYKNKVMNEKKVAVLIRVPMKNRGLSLECERVLHESLPSPILVYWSKIMIWKEKKKSRMRTVQMNNQKAMT